MDTIKLIENLIKHAESGDVNNTSLEKTLDVILVNTKEILKDNKISESIKTTNSVLKEKLDKQNKEFIKSQKSLDKALNQIEYLEPLFEKFKKESIGRLELIKIDKEIKKQLITKIKKAEYSEEIFDIMQLIELRTKEFFKEKTPLDIKNKKILNYSDYK